MHRRDGYGYYGYCLTILLTNIPVVAAQEYEYNANPWIIATAILLTIKVLIVLIWLMCRTHRRQQIRDAQQQRFMDNSDIYIQPTAVSDNQPSQFTNRGYSDYNTKYEDWPTGPGYANPLRAPYPGSANRPTMPTYPTRTNDNNPPTAIYPPPPTYDQTMQNSEQQQQQHRNL